MSENKPEQETPAQAAIEAIAQGRHLLGVLRAISTFEHMEHGEPDLAFCQALNKLEDAIRYQLGNEASSERSCNA